MKSIRIVLSVLYMLVALLALAGHAALAQVTPQQLNVAELGPTMTLVVGKSTLLRLPAALERISVGNPNVADVTLIGTKELYLLGKSFGTTNVILWQKNGPVTIIDLVIQVDGATLSKRLALLFPNEKGVQIETM